MSSRIADRGLFWQFLANDLIGILQSEALNLALERHYETLTTQLVRNCGLAELGGKR